MAKIVSPNKMNMRFIGYMIFATLLYWGESALAANCSSGLSISVFVPKTFYHIDSDHNPAGPDELPANILVTNISNVAMSYDETLGDIGVARDFKIILWSNEGYSVPMTHLAKRVYGLALPTENDFIPLNYENLGGSILPGETIRQHVNLAVLYHLKHVGSYSIKLERTDNGCSAASNIASFDVSN